MTRNSYPGFWGNKNVSQKEERKKAWKKIGNTATEMYLFNSPRDDFNYIQIILYGLQSIIFYAGNKIKINLINKTKHCKESFNNNTLWEAHNNKLPKHPKLYIYQESIFLILVVIKWPTVQS